MLQKNDIKVLLAPVVPISEAQGSAAKSDGRLNGRITRSVGYRLLLSSQTKSSPV